MEDKYTQEVKKFALDLYSSGTPVKEILGWVEAKCGIKPTVKVFNQWKKENGVKTYKAPKREPKVKLDYVEALRAEKIKAIEDMKDKLKQGKEDEQKIIGEALEIVGYHEANYVYPILSEYLKRGKLVNAQMLINNAVTARKQDEELLSQDIDNPSIIEQLERNQDTYKKMERISNVLMHIIDNDNHKTYSENYLDMLNRMHAKAKRKDEFVDTKEYEEWLSQGIIIFPNDLKLKNRYVNFLLSQNRANEAEGLLENVILSTDSNNLKADEYIPYLGARNVLATLKKKKQIQNGSRDFSEAKSIAAETLVMDPTNFDAQLHLAHIALLEGNFMDADRRITILAEQVNNDEGRKYGKTERTIIDDLSREIMKSRIENYGLPQILEQEDKKYGTHIDTSRYNEALKEIEKEIYSGKLTTAKQKIDELPINAQIELGGRYVKMQYFIASGRSDIAQKIFNAARPQENKTYDAMSNLFTLSSKIQSLEEREAEER